MRPIAKRVLVSLLVRQEDQLREQLAVLAGTVGWVELRLDETPADLDLAQLIADFPDLKFVAAILLEEEGGFFSGNREKRVRILQEAAGCGLDVVDLPLGNGTIELPAKVRRLVSWHQAPGTDFSRPLTELHQQASAEAGAVPRCS